MDANKKNIINPDMTTLFSQKIQNSLGNTNCILIGTIEKFNSTLQTAEISINYKRKVGDEFLKYPMLVDCPVVFLGGGAGYLTFPVAKGDTCVVMFCDRDIDTWLTYGQIKEPNSRRIHSLNDGIALVGIRSSLNPIPNFNSIITSLIDQSGERLSQSGDIKSSIRTANHSGWLIMDGKTIGNASSGADYSGAEHEELFDLLKEVDPNAGTEVFANNDTVIIKDMRGRGIVGADNMGGSQANILTASNQPNRNVLGGEIGEEKHQLTIAELAAHTHTVNPPSSQGSSGGGKSASGNEANETISQFNTGSTGGDVAHNNIPPGGIFYLFIKI